MREEDQALLCELEKPEESEQTNKKGRRKKNIH